MRNVFRGQGQEFAELGEAEPMDGSDVHATKCDLLAVRSDFFEPTPNTELHFFGGALRECKRNDAFFRDAFY